MSGVVSYELFVSKFPTGSGIGITSDGGIYATFVNDTGANSVLGTIVSASSAVNNAVSVTPGDGSMPIGAIAENGIANGNPVKVVISGKGYVLLKDGEAATRGYWCGVSDTSGRMMQLSTVPAATEHFREIGHSLQSVASGANVLSLVCMHFN